MHKINELINPVENENKNKIKIFTIAIIIATIIFLPFLIYNKGVFIFYGDYNSQQIPFYKLAHDAVRNKEFGINWTTDLGSNFVASYSFYLLGSPFFWLTIPFPNEFIPYLMAPLLILKIAVAALTSYIFIRKFTKTSNSAFFAALTYSFSGFSIYNIFFNHFHEIIAFFPLMLVGFENLISNKKKGVFALSVALNIIANFYFFVAEVVFLIIYFMLRCVFNKNFKISGKILFCLIAEAIIGVAIGFVLFLPSALMVMQNPRVQGCLLGFETIFYSAVQKYGLLLSSLFLPPDMPSLPNLFPDAQAKWSSVSAYVPMFGMTGVIAFLKEEKKSWLKKLIITLFIFMLVPFLNSAFNGFNSSFYARWFFSLNLTLALITAIAIEKHKKTFKFAIKFNLVVLLLFSIIGIIPKKVDDQIIFFNLPNHVAMFWINIFIAIFGLFLTKILFYNKKTEPHIHKKHNFLIFHFFIISYSITQLAWGKFYFEHNDYETIITNGMNFKPEIEDYDFYRMDIFPKDHFDNLNMFLKIPSVSAFQSTVPASIMQFYKNLGIKRDVSSKIPIDEYENLRNFLSVKYVFIPTESFEEVKSKLPKNFKFFKEQNKHKIYKNENFINIGFPMNNYIEEEEFSKLNKSLKDKALISCAILSKNQIKKYNKILNKITAKEIENLTKKDIQNNIDILKKKSCKKFEKNSYGFSASINLDRDELVVFSVPYESGFSATVNNKKAEIEQINSGIMAIRCNKGNNKIEFKYETPGLKFSILISIFGFVSLFSYLILVKKFFKPTY